jgi:hypothetical protein
MSKYAVSRVVRRVSCAALLQAAGLASVALAQPGNDALSGASLMAFPTTGLLGTTIGASNEGNITSACGTSQASADVWYLVTVPTAQTVVASTCGVATDSDTVIQVFNVGAGNTLGTQVACDDESCQNRKSRTQFSATAGTSYFIRVATRLATTGNFQLNVTPSTTPNPVDIEQTVGPDVTIGNISDVYYWGVSGTTKAFSVGTDSWNVGNQQADWFDYNTRLTINGNVVDKRSNEHPVIGQQMYRLKDGKFEQIGMSWLKHGFVSTNSAAFQGGLAVPSFTNRVRQTPTLWNAVAGFQQPGTGDWLGINCSDLYGGSLNGTQGAGPRYDVNPVTGAYTHPFTSLVPAAPATIGRRLQVPIADLANANARYFVDAVYITSDDMPWGNGANNYAARELVAANTNTTTVGSAGLPLAGGTARRKTALELWPEIDRSVKLAQVAVHEQTVNIRDYSTNPFTVRSRDLMGNFQVASKVTDLGNGTWSYEYAVMNLNSHRSTDGLVFRLPLNAVVSDEAYRAVPYHSGERIDNTPWISSKVNGKLSFDTNMTYPLTANFGGSLTNVAMDPNTIRWGGMANIRFIASVAPVTGYTKMSLWRAPTDATGYQGNVVAVNGILVPGFCVADLAGPGQVAGPDGEFTADDIIFFVNAFFGNDLVMADIAGAGQSETPDNQLTADDIIVFVNKFFAQCQ